MRESRGRFYNVNTLNVEQYCGKGYFSRNRQNGRETGNQFPHKCPNLSREIQVKPL